MLSDVSRCRPCAYVHRHNLHVRPPGFAKQGPNEVRMLLLQLDQLISKEPGDGKIFREKPHMTFDNFFSGDEIMDHIGQLGFAATMTCRRDRLPTGVPKSYFHHERILVDARSKAARFIQPITAVKKFPQVGENKAYTRTHVSFQSTGSTNLSSVNAVKSNQLYIIQKERGVGIQKRKWGVESNNKRGLYLGSYYKIDSTDASMSRCDIQYRSWKFWHSAMNHGLALAVVTAYDMYMECASGSLCNAWKVDQPMTFHEFRDRLSTQMLTYKPRFQWYPGDEAFHSTTVLSKKCRNKSYVAPNKRCRQTPNSVRPGGQFSLMPNDWETVRKTKRLCGEIHPNLAKHLRSFGEKGALVKSGARCAWCGVHHLRCTITQLPKEGKL